MTALQTYGRLHKFFHWWVAIHLGVILFAAFGLADLPLADKKQEYSDHGLATTLLLVVMVLRLLWRVRHPAPPLPEHMPRWERQAGRIAHCGLYTLVFLQCGVGFLLASTTEVDFIPNLIRVNYTAPDLVPGRFYGILQTLHATIY
ncbi:MAG: cytochrome b/b6 domain-containing protein, partial [Sneathiella sp.]